MIILNAILCGWISYVSFALMAHRHPPRTFRDMSLQVGLACVFAMALASAFMPFPTDESPQWWTLGLRTGGFIVATAVYDATFSIKRHWVLLKHWITHPSGWLK